MTDRDTLPQAERYYPLWELIVARLREFCREPWGIFWVYLFPSIMVLVLGIAFRTRSVEPLEVVVQETEGASLIRNALGQDTRFHVQVCNAADCRRCLRTGKADLLIVVEEAGAGCHYYFDPTRPGSMLARNSANDVLQRVTGRQDTMELQDHEVTEAGGRYVDFLIPGLIGFCLMGGGMWSLGFAIVDLRIRKLLKRYLATPMRKSHFLAAVMISRWIFAVPGILLVLLFAHVSFGVVSQGSYLTVGVLVFLGVFEFTGIGLLIASRVQTFETVSGAMNLVMLPQWVAAGIFFPVERFPQVFHPVIQLLPLTPLIDALRRVMLEGAGISSIGMQLGFIVAWGVVTFVLALRWFRWS